jgi:Cytochrome c3
MMFDNRIIHRDAFYNSNHNSFACTDCHSANYDTFPHPGELRMEDPYNCIDCHGNDENFARFHFEEIEAEFQQSTHYKSVGDAFTCWKCHNPHTYKLNIRGSKDITQAIAYDNQFCLNCHSDFERFQLLTDKKEINIIQKHEWLPNQALHFSQVRCIECHARPNDSLLVAHLIMPKEKAVKRCVECHSQNSLLMSSLYKFQAKETRTQAGFLNAIILNNAFVIGANRNVILNKVSIVIFFVVIVLLLIHLLLRIRTKKKDSKND